MVKRDKNVRSGSLVECEMLLPLAWPHNLWESKPELSGPGTCPHTRRSRLLLLTLLERDHPGYLSLTCLRESERPTPRWPPTPRKAASCLSTESMSPSPIPSSRPSSRSLVPSPTPTILAKVMPSSPLRTRARPQMPRRH